MKKHWDILAAAAVVVTVGIAVGAMFATSIRAAHADIINPHPTPPANSVTHAMLKTGIVDDSNVDTAAAIQLFKIGTLGDDTYIPFGTTGGLATSTSLSFDSGTDFLDTTNLSVSSGKTTLHGVSFTWPASDGSSGTFLSTDGAGTLSWGSVAFKDEGSKWTGTLVSSTSNATETVATYTFPAGTFDGRKQINYWGWPQSTVGSNIDCYVAINLGNGTATTTWASDNVNEPNGATVQGFISSISSTTMGWTNEFANPGRSVLSMTPTIKFPAYATSTPIYLSLSAHKGGTFAGSCGFVGFGIKLE